MVSRVTEDEALPRTETIANAEVQLPSALQSVAAPPPVAPARLMVVEFPRQAGLSRSRHRWRETLPNWRVRTYRESSRPMEFESERPTLSERSRRVLRPRIVGNEQLSIR